MYHRTFAFITQKESDEKSYLFLQEENSELYFFTWKSMAINGIHDPVGFKKSFCEFFNINAEQYESFILERIPLTQAGTGSDESTAIYEIKVPQDFVNLVKPSTKEICWINISDLGDISKNQGTYNFRESEKWVLDYFQPFSQTDFEPELLHALKAIELAKEQQKLVIFAGAGISIDSGAPSWNEMSEAILKSLGLRDAYAEAPVIGQWLYNERRGNQYDKQLLDILGFHRNFQPNAIHKQLASSGARHLVTTNFDDLLEKALKETNEERFESEPYSVIRSDKDLPSALVDKYLVKMHGDWIEKNFVFKENDYLNYSTNFPLIETFIRGIFSSYQIVFVGYSFSDPNLKQIINWVKEILGRDFRPAYIFQAEPIEPHKGTYFKNNGIIPISYNNSIETYLREIRQYRIDKNLKWRGQRTLDFLRLIDVFSSNDYERLHKVRKQHVLEQMYDGLRPFESINCISPLVFEQMFPFSPTVFEPGREQMHAEYSLGNHLLVKNESIIRLMENVEFKENEILLKSNSLESQAIERIPNHLEKLAFVFDKLISSGVKCIQRSRSDTHHRIRYITEFDKKTMFSSWMEFRYDSIFSSIANYPYNANFEKSLNERLLESMILYRLNYSLEAYLAFSEIARSAIENEDYVTFFFCQYNKQIAGRRTVRIAEIKRYSPVLIAQIEADLNTIDLSGYLNRIRVEKAVKSFLRSILTQTDFEEFEGEVRESHQRILSIYKMFKNPNSESSGSNEVEQLTENYTNLYRIYFSNGLLFKGEDKFNTLTSLLFEGLIASHSTGEKYEYRLKEIDAFSLIATVRFLNASEIVDIINKYELSIIRMDHKHKDLFIEYAINWFSSCFNVNNFFFFQVKQNEDFLHHLNENGLLSPETKRLSNNFLLLLGHIEFDDLLDQPQVNKLIDAVLKSIEYSLLSNNLIEVQHFTTFLTRHNKYFSDTQLETVLLISAKDRHWPREVCRKLVKTLSKVRPGFRLSKKTTFNALTTYKPTQSEMIYNRVEDIVSLNRFFDSILKRALRKAVSDRLEELKNSVEGLELWLDAKIEGVIKSEAKMPDNLLTTLRQQYSGITALKFRETDGEPILNFTTYDIRIPYRVALLAYRIGMDAETIQEILNDQNAPLSLCWMLDPVGFKYEDFDPSWVFFFDEATILKKIGLMRIPALISAFHQRLSTSYSPALAKIYFEYFKAPIEGEST